MSTDLQWLLIRKFNSFQHVTKNGRSFTKEPVSRVESGLGDELGKEKEKGIDWGPSAWHVIGGK